MSKILDKIEQSFEQKLPFVCYRKPNITEVLSFFQKDDSLFFSDDFTESGFVFAPFDNIEKAILIPITASEFIKEKIELNSEIISNQKEESSFSSKENHIRLVEKAITEIKSKNFKKVVVSRKVTIKLNALEIKKIFENMLIKYPTAMVSVWFHPKVGLWFGATPETLLKSENNRFETMSLAGTQVYKEDEEPIWKSKEIEEQQLVTNFVENQLKGISSNLKIEEKETIKAGNLLHLKTKISGKIDSKNQSLKALIKALHPTPAVCGLPRKITKEFILENENYDRKFYTGFLGELNLENKSALFVNLRCMEINEKEAIIYVGGGITKDSNPEKEWEETVAKSNTMKQVL